MLTGAAVCVSPILYLIVIWHYGTNALQFDEWNVIPFLHSALHGHLSFGQIWSQHGEPRLPLVRLDLLFFAVGDHLNVRAALFASAAVLIGSYGLLLPLLRRYNGRLTALYVLVIGCIWFSLGDVQNALWAFQIGWYLVVFGFTAMLFAFLVPSRRRVLWYAVAILAAIVATFGAIQGFVVWPLGIVCILWSQPRSHRMSREVVGWVAAFLGTAVVYLIGYDTSQTSCSPVTGCTPTHVWNHPIAAVRFFLILIGNVIPGRYLPNAYGSVVRFEVIGGVLLVASLFVIVRSLRDRVSEPLPLPLLLITFALLFDGTVAWGRIGEGLSGAVHDNRYVMPNLLLLTGIVIYAWVHVPRLTSIAWKSFLSLAVAALVVVQLAVATDVGLASASTTHAFLTGQARVAVNLDRIPPAERPCYIYRYLVQTTNIPEARHDQLAEFGPDSYSVLRGLGPPTSVDPFGVEANCS